jgi:hypothetical protein
MPVGLRTLYCSQNIQLLLMQTAETRLLDGRASKSRPWHQLRWSVGHLPSGFPF